MVISPSDRRQRCPLKLGGFPKRTGINSNFSDDTIQRIRKKVQEIKQERGSRRLHSLGRKLVHVPQEEIDFGHQLIEEAGVDIIHGHSSHHIKGIRSIETGSSFTAAVTF